MALSRIQEIPISEAACRGLASLAPAFVACLTPEQKDIVFEAFFRLDYLSNGFKIPRPFQLDFTLALREGRDVVLRAGTGYGKTIAMVLPIILSRGQVAITISPLKLLQETQVDEFCRYGIRSIAINEDTPNDPQLWKDAREAQNVDQYLISSEQLFPYKGHIPRFATFLHEPKLVKKISYIFIDEAHFIKTSGTSVDGQPAHRPSYARLGEVRARLPAGIPVALLSATLPSHVMEICTKSLHMKPDNTTYIKLSTNRPNLMHAVIPMVGDIKNFANVDFLVPLSYHPPMAPIEKTLLFIESKLKTGHLTRYLLQRFSKAWRKQRPVRHIHSGMSKAHNKEAYDSFKDPNGACVILIATSSASNGIDVSNITRVIIFGVPKNPIDLDQRGGRGGRSFDIYCLVLLIAESWAYDGENTAKAALPTNAKVQRTESAIFQYVPLCTCRRHFLKTYNGDETAEGSTKSLVYTSPWCCDNHDDGFDINFFFLLPTLPSAPPTVPIELFQTKRRTYRKVAHRDELERRLRNWRRVVRSDDPVFRSFPDLFLLSDDAITSLAKAKPADLSNEDAVVTHLEESDEWKEDFAAEVFSVIDEYNMELKEVAKEAKRVKNAEKQAARLKARRMKGRPNGEDSDDYEIESEDEDDTIQPSTYCDEVAGDPSESEEGSDEDEASNASPPVSPPSSPPISPVASPTKPNHGATRGLVRPRPTEFLPENIVISPRPLKRARRVGTRLLSNTTNTSSKDSQV